jgi:hypothetical protein
MERRRSRIAGSSSTINTGSESTAGRISSGIGKNSFPKDMQAFSDTALSAFPDYQQGK